MKITPLDIQQQTFKNAFFKGYEKGDVDHFLKLVREELEKLVIELNSVRDDLKRRESQVTEFQSRERILKDTMITAQKITEDIKQGAKKEAELIISQAEVQADKIIKAAQDRLNEVIDDIHELKRQRVMFEAELKALVDKHAKLIEMVSDENIKEPGVEDRISFLTK